MYIYQLHNCFADICPWQQTFYHCSHTNQRHRLVAILGKHGISARSANHAVRAWQFGWLEHGWEVSHPTHCSFIRNSIYNLAQPWCQWDLWCYSYSSRSIICQRQQHGQRDPPSELARLTISGRRIEHGQGVRKAQSDRRLVCWDTTKSTRDPLPEVAQWSVPFR